MALHGSERTDSWSTQDGMSEPGGQAQQIFAGLRVGVGVLFVVAVHLPASGLVFVACPAATIISLTSRPPT